MDHDQNESVKQMYQSLPLRRLTASCSGSDSPLKWSSGITPGFSNQNMDGCESRNEIVLLVVACEHRKIVGGKQALKQNDSELFLARVTNLVTRLSDGTRIVPTLSFGYQQNAHLPLHMFLDLDVVNKLSDEKGMKNVTEFEAQSRLTNLVRELSTELTNLVLRQNNVTKSGVYKRNHSSKDLSTVSADGDIISATVNSSSSCNLTAHISQRKRNGGAHVVWTGGAISLQSLVLLRSYLAKQFNRKLQDDFNLQIDTGVSGVQLPGSSKSGLLVDVYNSIKTGQPDSVLPWCPGGSCCRGYNSRLHFLVPSAETFRELTALATRHINKTTTRTLLGVAKELPAPHSNISEVTVSHTDQFFEFRRFCKTPQILNHELPSLGSTIDSIGRRGFVSWIWDNALNEHLFLYLNDHAFIDSDDDEVEGNDSSVKRHARAPVSPETAITHNLPKSSSPHQCDNQLGCERDAVTAGSKKEAKSTIPNPNHVCRESKHEKHLLTQSHIDRVLGALALVARFVVKQPDYQQRVTFFESSCSNRQQRQVGNSDTGFQDSEKRFEAQHSARLVYDWLVTSRYSLNTGSNVTLNNFVFEKMAKWYDEPSSYHDLVDKFGDKTYIGVLSLLNASLNLPETVNANEVSNYQKTTHVHVSIGINLTANHICETYISENSTESVSKVELFVTTLLAILFPVVTVREQECDYLWLQSGFWVTTDVNHFGSIIENTLSLLAKLKVSVVDIKTQQLVPRALYRTSPTVSQVYTKCKTMWRGLTSQLSGVPNGVLVTSNNTYFSLLTRQLHNAPLYEIYTDCEYSMGFSMSEIQLAVANVDCIWKLFQTLLTAKNAAQYESDLLEAADLVKFDMKTRKYFETLTRGFYYIWEILRQPIEDPDCDSVDNLSQMIPTAIDQPQKPKYDNLISSDRIAFVVSQLATIIFRRNPKFIWIIHSNLPNTSKSTFLLVIRKLLGQRFASLSAANITKSGSTSSELKRPDLVNLNHRYIYAIDELPTGIGASASGSGADKIHRKEIDNEIIRQITGDMVTSGFRELHKNNSGKFIHFRGALVIACNQLPCFRTDKALNERLVFTNFPNPFERSDNLTLEQRVEEYIVPALLAFTLADFYMRASKSLHRHRGPDHAAGIAYYDHMLTEGPIEDLLRCFPHIRFVPTGSGNATITEVTAVVYKFGLSTPNGNDTALLMALLKDRGGYNEETETFSRLTLRYDVTSFTSSSSNSWTSTKSSGGKKKRKSTASENNNITGPIGTWEGFIRS